MATTPPELTTWASFTKDAGLTAALIGIGGKLLVDYVKEKRASSKEQADAKVSEATQDALTQKDLQLHEKAIETLQTNVETIRSAQAEHGNVLNRIVGLLEGMGHGRGGGGGLQMPLGAQGPNKE